ncbi:TetR family transcriptional regulator [Lysinibacillus sp. PLM2]|nr:TetR family transcriptional regulator [Lysinibacillus sp. PLM2]
MNNRKRQIINAARKLFIEKGFNDTSIMDIIASANVSKGTFYNHFTSKNECLIAILEESREVTVNRRFEVAMNEDPSDLNVLVKQISLLLHVNREHNLLEIFESISGFKDADLKEVLEKHTIQELNWLANRLVDVFGEEIRSVSYDCAISLFGILSQTLRTISITTKQNKSPENIVFPILKRIESMLPHLISTSDLIITPDIVQALQNKIEEKIIKKEDLVQQLQGFIKNLTDFDSGKGKEYAEFILCELKSSDRNYSILEVVVAAFNKSFRNSRHEAEAHEISVHLWRYMHKKKEELL